MEKNLKQFLIIAKQKSYAGGGEKRARSLTNGQKEYLFKKGDLKYIDRYRGHEKFSGREKVFKAAKLIWSMEYSGGVLSKKISPDDIYAFLRKALKIIPKNNPFRGPKKLVEGDYKYINKIKGALNNFSGEEKIFYKDKLIYQLNYSGGASEKINNIAIF
jgi:hypothetical protein